MGNMNYCKFRNTLEDLRDCQDTIFDKVESADEEKARRNLLALCCIIAEQVPSDEESEEE
jgi:hypothetical protein